jgi:hypothetical protein
VVQNKPFTIQLLYNSKEYTQPVSLGIDSGYTYIGYSAITEDTELISGEVELLSGQSERLKEKAMYRRQSFYLHTHRLLFQEDFHFHTLSNILFPYIPPILIDHLVALVMNANV